MSKKRVLIIEDLEPFGRRLEEELSVAFDVVAKASLSAGKRVIENADAVVTNCQIKGQPAISWVVNMIRDAAGPRGLPLVITVDHKPTASESLQEQMNSRFRSYFPDHYLCKKKRDYADIRRYLTDRCY